MKRDRDYMEPRSSLAFQRHIGHLRLKESLESGRVRLHVNVVEENVQFTRMGVSIPRCHPLQTEQLLIRVFVPVATPAVQSPIADETMHRLSIERVYAMHQAELGAEPTHEVVGPSLAAWFPR